MNILLDSSEGDGLALALALQREDHDVCIAIDKDDSQLVGEGLIEHVTDPFAYVREHDVDLVLFDMVGKGGEADSLRDDGVQVYGAGRILDLLELDRMFGLKTFAAMGLSLPETVFFEDGNLDKAIQFVQRDGGGWVFKPCGNLGNDKTFLAHDADEMAEFIQSMRDHAKGEDAKFPAFVMQRIVKGVEVSVERVYSCGMPVPGLDTMTFEEKKFLNGNLGPAIGCAGNIVLDAPPKLVSATVAHLDLLARHHGISAFVDLNSIVDEKTGIPYVLEATARFGYAALWANLARWNMPLGETFLNLAMGVPFEVHTDPRMSAAVVVSVPPFPCGDAHDIRNNPVVDDILDEPHVWPYDIFLPDVADGKLKIAGCDGLIYTVTGIGTTPKEAYRACYDWLDSSRLPDRQYRTDLLDRVDVDLPKIGRLYG